MPDQDRMQKLKALVMSLLSSDAPAAQAAPMGPHIQGLTPQVQPQMQPLPPPGMSPNLPPTATPNQDALLAAMQQRKAALDQQGGNHTGGMFDIIYRKRKEREDALRELGF